MKCEEHPLLDLDEDGSCSACEGLKANRIAAAMSRLRDARFAVAITAGELFDRITILQIKAVRVEDLAARRRAGEEYKALEKFVYGDDQHVALPGITELVGQLKQTNINLWNIEDEIRALDAAIWVGGFELGEFESHIELNADSEHVLSDEIKRYCELARSVYVTNDERSRLKAAINEACGHPTEVKQYAEYNA